MSPAVRPSGDVLQVKPGQAWRELLLAPDAFDWLTHITATLSHPAHQQHLRGADAQILASQARYLLVGLSCLPHMLLKGRLSLVLEQRTLIATRLQCVYTVHQLA